MTRTLVFCFLLLIADAARAVAEERRFGIVLEAIGSITRNHTKDARRQAQVAVLDPVFSSDKFWLASQAKLKFCRENSCIVYSINGPAWVEVVGGSVKSNSTALGTSANGYLRESARLAEELPTNPHQESRLSFVCVDRTPFRLAFPDEMRVEPHSNQVVVYFRELGKLNEEPRPTAALYFRMRGRWWIEVDSALFRPGHSYALWVGIPPNNTHGALVVHFLSASQLGAINAMAQKAKTLFDRALLIEAYRRLRLWARLQESLVLTNKLFPDVNNGKFQAYIDESQRWPSSDTPSTDKVGPNKRVTR